ncbi:MAG: hypothetical protein Q7T55_00535, partial [Solirubrobacteraceae bacterium]|nr:hypothetical protein [Solirubrobacteraceae bacterium]
FSPKEGEKGHVGGEFLPLNFLTPPGFEAVSSVKTTSGSAELAPLKFFSNFLNHDARYLNAIRPHNNLYFVTAKSYFLASSC